MINIISLKPFETDIQAFLHILSFEKGRPNFCSYKKVFSSHHSLSNLFRNRITNFSFVAIQISAINMPISAIDRVLYSCLDLIPVALLPLTAGLAGPFYGIGAGLLSVAYLVASVAFARREDRARARAVVVTSLFYLPLWAGLILTDSLVSASLR